MTKIKFCGLMRPCDIDAANALEPEYIGFVFAKKSRRAVTPEQAQELRARLKDGIKAVGVFVDEKPEVMSALANAGIIDMIQLHGHEDEVLIRRLRTLTACPVIRAYRTVSKAGGGAYAAGPAAAAASKHKEAACPSAIADPKQEEAHSPAAVTAPGCAGFEQLRADMEGSGADYILLDSGAGTGVTFDWSLIRDIRRDYFLAGGLDPENVAGAVRLLHPYAVDVSSGIETDGRKDPQKMAAFAAAVRKA